MKFVKQLKDFYTHSHPFTKGYVSGFLVALLYCVIYLLVVIFEPVKENNLPANPDRKIEGNPGKIF